MSIFGKIVEALFGKEKEEQEAKETQSNTLEEVAWYHGYHAREEGKSKEFCPYRKGGLLYSKWIEGWSFANELDEQCKRKRR